MAISSTLAWSAAGQYLRLGTRHENLTFLSFGWSCCCCRSCSVVVCVCRRRHSWSSCKTSGLLAMVGTMRGETKLATSKVRHPASMRRRINSTLLATETTLLLFSFCKPSRGPTSTMQTEDDCRCRCCFRVETNERRRLHCDPRDEGGNRTTHRTTP